MGWGNEIFKKVKRSRSKALSEIEIKLGSGQAPVKKNKYLNKKTLYKGILFDSKLESLVYQALEFCVFTVERQVEYELMPSFVFLGEKIKRTLIRPDFRLRHPVTNQVLAILDAKSKFSQTEKSKLQIKLLKAHLILKNEPVPIFLVESKAQAYQIINTLKINYNL